LEKLWQFGMAFSDIILLFSLAWLVSFVLNPLVDWLSGDGALPAEQPAGKMRLPTLRLPRALAVLLIYLSMVVIVVMIGFYLAPTLVAQMRQLGNTLSEAVDRAPVWLSDLQQFFAQFNLPIDLTKIYQPEDLARRLAEFGALLVANAPAMAAGVAAMLGNLFLILILSFYFTLDGHRLTAGLIALVPLDWRDEAHFFAQSIDRTFGGFIRGQLVQALLFGIGTSLVMLLMGLNFVLVTALFASVLMLIPIIGIPLAFVPPLLVALFEQPGLAVWIVLILLVYQQVIVNVLMPRLMSEMMGMHPVLVFAAMLVGIRVGGFWGALFGIPVGGVIYAMAAFLYERAIKPKADAK
jgi:predicted PurR-regulated permease PerM